MATIQRKAADYNTDPTGLVVSNLTNLSLIMGFLFDESGELKIDEDDKLVLTADNPYASFQAPRGEYTTIAGINVLFDLTYSIFLAGMVEEVKKMMKSIVAGMRSMDTRAVPYVKFWAFNGVIGVVPVGQAYIPAREVADLPEIVVADIDHPSQMALGQKMWPIDGDTNMAGATIVADTDLIKLAAKVSGVTGKNFVKITAVVTDGLQSAGYPEQAAHVRDLTAIAGTFTVGGDPLFYKQFGIVYYCGGNERTAAKCQQYSETAGMEFKNLNPAAVGPDLVSYVKSKSDLVAEETPDQKDDVEAETGE